MCGNQEIPATAGEHYDKVEPERAGMHSLPQTEIPEALMRNNPMVFSALSPDIFMTKGFLTEIIGVTFNNQERQGYIDSNHDQGNIEIGSSPPITHGKNGEEGKERELPEAIAGQGKADGKTT